MSDGNSQLDEIVAQAIETPPHLRQQYLLHACEGDRQLYDQAAELVKQREQQPVTSPSVEDGRNPVGGDLRSVAGAGSGNPRPASASDARRVSAASDPDRAKRIQHVIAKCRRQLTAGKDFQDEGILAKFPDLMPELAGELRKLRLIEGARRQAEQPPQADSGHTDPPRNPNLWPSPKFNDTISANSGDTSSVGQVSQPVKPVGRASEPVQSSDEEFFPPKRDGFGEPSYSSRIFGDYELLKEIARGGMGVVYRARQLSLNRIVALKMILAGNLASDQEVQRFHTEAEAAAKLQHPNIVPIYEVGEHEGQHYFSMAYIQGRGLDELIRENPLSCRQAATYIKAIAEAIQYAHEQGVLHRDLKPSNVLIDEKGQPHITDFGLAKQVGSDSDLTATGQVLGTPSYMPPEQAYGEQDQLGPHSDIYSLGALLYALITGRPPFQGENAAKTLMQVIQDEPVSPRLLNAEIDRDLETIYLKCLAKETHKRYGSANDLEAELNRYLCGEPIQARPISRSARVLRWCKQNPIVTTSASMAVFFLLGGTIVSSYFAFAAYNWAGAATQEKAEALRLAAEAQRERDEAERQRDKANRKLYLNQIVLAQREWETNNREAAWNHLNSCEWHLRGWEHDYLFTRFMGGKLELRGHTARIYCVAFSPDGLRIVSGSGDDTIKLWDAMSGQEILTLRGHTDAVARVAFSPDGLRIVSSSFDRRSRIEQGTIKVWDANTGVETLTFSGHKSSLTILAFNRDGSQIVTGSPNVIKVWDATTGANLSTVESNWKGNAAISPDGTKIVGSSADHTIKVWNAKNGEELLTLEDSMHNTGRYAFSSDSARIVSGTLNGRIIMWSATTGAKLLTLKWHTPANWSKAAVTSLAFNYCDSPELADSRGFPQNLFEGERYVNWKINQQESRSPDVHGCI